MIHILKYYFHYETKVMKLGSLLVDCIDVQSSSIRAPWSSLPVKKSLSSFLCWPIFAVNSWQQQKNHSLHMPLISPSSLIDCCVLVAALGKMTQKRECFGIILCEIGKIERTHIVFYTKIHSLPLTFNNDRGSERPELAGSKMALLFFQVRWNSEIHALHEFGWKWVFFSKK